MKTTVIFFLFLIIATQTVHTYYVFESFSEITQKWLKLFQAIAFCLIVSGCIALFVLMDKPWLAIGGSIVEGVINIYYYGKAYFENGLRQRKEENRREAIRSYWRRYWIKYLFAVLIPSLIYVLSQLLHTYDFG